MQSVPSMNEVPATYDSSVCGSSRTVPSHVPSLLCPVSSKPVKRRFRTQAESHGIGAAINTDFDLVETSSNTRGSRGAFWFLSDPDWRAQYAHTVSETSEYQALNVRIPRSAYSTQYQYRRRVKSVPISQVLSEPRHRDHAQRTRGANPKSNASDNSAIVTSVDVDSSGTNPFLRLKRNIPSSISTSCSIPSNLPAKVRDLNSFLADRQYIGVIPTQDSYVSLPSDQPQTSCPAATGSWWPRPEINLRSTCPWVWEVLDNGPDAYPRYIRKAKCMCQRCIDARAHSCHEIHQAVTIFRLKSCQDGLAVMEKDMVTVSLGCFCAAPEPNTAQSATIESLPLTD
ncbi:interleukin-17d [Plakobranchus ocellatus]|uniref:Interleukin-17d n=1 Tax=Plakobranchus ocellatus TaxID=259542 RepID=A0AAV4B616_9GAST|nr:interleukin-17d [Plakobranchus ocellatus]